MRYREEALVYALPLVFKRCDGDRKSKDLELVDWWERKECTEGEEDMLRLVSSYLRAQYKSQKVFIATFKNTHLLTEGNRPGYENKITKKFK
jgi:hypothetical protein